MIAALIGLAVLSPVFILLSMGVKMTSKGPVFFKQERIGKNFVPFNMIKFRSMIVNDANSNQLVTASGDPRITPVGKVLRRYKLDELPQLLNVILGDMSLVGPRPEVMRYIEHHKKEYACILRLADNIFIEELKKYNLYNKVNQAFAVFLPIKSVGVTGDERRYDYVISLRAVETVDFMTARWARLPYDFLDDISNRIINEITRVSRVVYDISGKPPSTIEWE